MNQPINTKIPEVLGPILKQIVLELNMSIRQIQHDVHSMRYDINGWIKNVLKEGNMFTKEEICTLIKSYDQTRAQSSIVSTENELLRVKLLKLLELKLYE